MSALSARVSTVPGRSVIGIELPNAHRERWCCARSCRRGDYGDSNMRLRWRWASIIGGGPVVANPRQDAPPADQVPPARVNRWRSTR
ncbi:MAG: hypothetical protein R3D59_04320 [Paracoccaceae bacterium]